MLVELGPVRATWRNDSRGEGASAGNCIEDERARVRQLVGGTGLPRCLRTLLTLLRTEQLLGKNLRKSLHLEVCLCDLF